ncbi:MAG TPA: hypothetical protein VJ885_09705 [Thermoanaerobaculia bacterium]|nr:hypothetical protein [Thermoanaerobaculia bacterium]
MRGWLWLLLLCWVLAAPAVLHGAAGPFWTVGRDGTLLVSGLPDILSRPEVRPHLKTGLTTTFAIRVTATDETGAKVKGAGRIDLRWELWDEVFLTTMAGSAGRARQESLPTPERLAAWWRGLEIPAAAGLAPGGRWQVKVELSVIPFSRSEQRDAQRWVSDTLGDGARGGGAGPPTAPGQPQVDSGPALGGVLDLLIVTSIKRPNVATYVWTASPRTVR